MNKLLVLALFLASCNRSVAPKVMSSIPETDGLTRGDIVSNVPAVAAALGLGATATPEQMRALERRAKETGKFDGQACGATMFGGRHHSFYSNAYRIRVVGFAEPQYLDFDHIQHGEHPIFGVSGPGFMYQLEGGVFVLMNREGR